MWNSMMGIALAGLLIAVPAVTSAQAPATEKSSKLSRADEKFLKEAAGDNLAEVKLGELAEQHAASDSVKEFGKRMATDHQKAYDELKQLASQKGVMVPTALDRTHQALYDRLAKLNGADFDRAYMKEMVKDHDKDVKEFQKQANSGKDPDLKSWASTTLSILKEHQQQAKQVLASVEGKSTPAASPRQK